MLAREDAVAGKRRNSHWSEETQLLAIKDPVAGKKRHSHWHEEMQLLF